MVTRRKKFMEKEWLSTYDMLLETRGKVCSSNVQDVDLRSRLMLLVNIKKASLD